MDIEKENEYEKENEDTIYPKMYPILNSSAPPEINIYKEDIHEMNRFYKRDLLELDINKLRIDNFLKEKKHLEKLLKHYKKLKNKWTNIDSSLKMIILSISGILGISSLLLASVSTLGAGLFLYVGFGTGILSF